MQLGVFRWCLGVCQLNFLLRAAHWPLVSDILPQAGTVLFGTVENIMRVSLTPSRRPQTSKDSSRLGSPMRHLLWTRSALGGFVLLGSEGGIGGSFANGVRIGGRGGLGLVRSMLLVRRHREALYPDLVPIRLRAGQRRAPFCWSLVPGGLLRSAPLTSFSLGGNRVGRPIFLNL